MAGALRRQLNQIDPNSTKPQSLINWDGFPTYNFDVIDGVNYQIDVTQPARYDGECQMINANAERIKNLTFNGKPIDPKRHVPGYHQELSRLRRQICLYGRQPDRFCLPA